MKTTKDRMFYCPDCDGDGEIVTQVNTGYGIDHENETVDHCWTCMGEGIVRSDDPDFEGCPYTPSKRRSWSDTKPYRAENDLLARMGRIRATPETRWEGMYGWNRKMAMRPVSLPGGAR